MPITYLKGDATDPKQIKDEKMFLLHVCNNKGRWGRGFVLAISNRWYEPESEYRKLKNYDLGVIQIVKINDDLSVVNMIAQNGLGTYRRRVDYKQVKVCLNSFNSWVTEYKKKHKTNISIHMPRIGCGLGGGNWKTVEKIINNEIGEHNVFVYDFGKK